MLKERKMEWRVWCEGKKRGWRLWRREEKGIEGVAKGRKGDGGCGEGKKRGLRVLRREEKGIEGVAKGRKGGRVKGM